MVSVSVHEAKTHLSRLLRRVAAGEEVVIRRGSEPVARLVAFSPSGDRRFGCDRGAFTVPDNFDEPLPEEILREFEG